MQVGTDRAIPTSVAKALSKEIKDFIEDEAPLMMLMSSPGIKKRHWDQIVKTTGIALPYEQDFVLRDLLDAGLQNFCVEIEEVCIFLFPCESTHLNDALTPRRLLRWKITSCNEFRPGPLSRC